MIGEALRHESVALSQSGIRLNPVRIGFQVVDRREFFLWSNSWRAILKYRHQVSAEGKDIQLEPRETEKAPAKSVAPQAAGYMTGTGFPASSGRGSPTLGWTRSSLIFRPGPR
jgi:hypothetical protein